VLDHFGGAFLVAGVLAAVVLHGVLGDALGHGADEADGLFDYHLPGRAPNVGAVQHPAVEVAEDQRIGDVSLQV
jgi:hypothetical protein